jgi:speckle-type POZ protein
MAGLVVVPPPDVGLDILQLLWDGEGSDVSFEVAGETFRAHRYILAARSPVFMAELYGPMNETTETCVRIDDMEARVFKLLLHFVYTDWLPEMDEGVIVVMSQHLLVAADRYGLERLKLFCEHNLCSRINASTVATTLALAEQHGCQGLKKACVQFLKSSSNLKAAMATDGFEHLTRSCPNVLEELLAMVAP